MTEKEKLLIDILLDPSASISERDDAAMELWRYSSEEVANALIRVGKCSDEDEIVLNSCGESLGQIWLARDSFDLNAYKSLSADARFGVFFVVRATKPEWVASYKLDEDTF